MSRAWSARLPYLAIVASTIACASVLGLDDGLPLDAAGDGGTGGPALDIAVEGGAVAPGATADGSAQAIDDATAPVNAAAPDSADPKDSSPALDAVVDAPCVSQPVATTCGAQQCGTAVDNCGHAVACGADGGTACASAGVCTSSNACCAQPASCNATQGCCEGTYCWAGQSLGDDGTCKAASCPAQYAPCVAVGDCCFGYVCQGNTQSGYFCE